MMSNYWPISLTSVIGKMFESAISNKIREHLELYKLITDSAVGSLRVLCVSLILYLYKATDKDLN